MAHRRRRRWRSEWTPQRTDVLAPTPHPPPAPESVDDYDDVLRRANEAARSDDDQDATADGAEAAGGPHGGTNGDR